MTRPASVAYFLVAFVLSIALISSFAGSVKANSNSTSTSALEQRVDDLNAKLSDHILTVQKLPERVTALESAVDNIKDRISESTWMIRALIGAVLTEIVRRIKMNGGAAKSG